jgi:MFS family permease
VVSRNIPLFIAFRVLFHVRFYYPILGVLFLDLGLTVGDYALLNAIWAGTIILAEIPSGAIGDAIGRKKIVVLAAGLMVVEMALLLFAPSGGGAVLFAVLAANRIVSGLAEACCSGSDEALAYDSLPGGDRDRLWPGVLARLMRWQSGAFLVAMLVGAILFDPGPVVTALAWLGWEWSPGETTRWPVVATFATSLACLGVALVMSEAECSGPKEGLRAAFPNILRGARHVFSGRRILMLMATALVCDSFVRLFLTFSSNFVRLVALPDAATGLIGAGFAMLGFATAAVARTLVARKSAVFNFALASVLIFTGLVGAAFATPHFGVWVMVPLGLAANAVGFFLSHYLNSWTSSDVRATVLSFRGVALNLGYGAIGVAFATLSGRLRADQPAADDNRVFHLALEFLPIGFAVATAALGLLAFAQRTRRE